MLAKKREPFNLQDAWQSVGSLYATIVALFGEPFEIASQFLLMRELRRDILSWLGPVEALARRILLLKALSLPPSNAPSAKPAPGRIVTAFADRAIPDLHVNSTKWNVRFNVMPRGALSRKVKAERTERVSDRRYTDIEFNALPLGKRLEALRRLLENPAPAVARLCRLLASRRTDVESAFRTYRPTQTAVQSPLEDVQRELDLALNTS